MKTSSRKRFGFGLVLLFGVGLILMLTQCSPPPTSQTNTVSKVKPFTIADLVADMVSIPAGTFVMGSPNNEQNRGNYEGPQTTVTISKPFWMSKFEVTQGQYEELMGNNPAHFKVAGLNAPVEKVSWNNAVEFCRQLTEKEKSVGRLEDGYEYHLPTEAQWEYACRAGTTTRFSYGDDDSELGKYAWFDHFPDGSTYSVGAKLANPWGLHDMHGNVWEWCLDWYGKYPGGAQVDPVGANTGTRRVRRGGSWNFDGGYCRSDSRLGNFTDTAFVNLGFRPALVSVDSPKSPD